MPEAEEPPEEEIPEEPAEEPAADEAVAEGEPETPAEVPVEEVKQTPPSAAQAQPEQKKAEEYEVLYTITAKQGAALREEADDHSPVLVTLEAESELKVVDDAEEGWYGVLLVPEMDGHAVAYLSESDVTPDEVPAEPETFAAEPEAPAEEEPAITEDADEEPADLPEGKATVEEETPEEPGEAEEIPEEPEAVKTTEEENLPEAEAPAEEAEAMEEGEPAEEAAQPEEETVSEVLETDKADNEELQGSPAASETPSEEGNKEAENERRVTVHSTLGETVFSGETVELTAELEGFEEEEAVLIVWEVNRGEGWEELVIGESCKYIVSAETMTWEFRARVQIQE